jgi:hypothetical protein
MAQTHDWLPRSREKMVAMAEAWVNVLLANTNANATAWGFPAGSVTAFKGTLDTAKTALEKAMNSPERTAVITEECKTAFTALEKTMRDFKKRYFLMPPLTETDMVSLQLPLKDDTQTPVPVPKDQCGAEVYKRDLHTIGLRLFPTDKTLSEDPRANHGFRVYWGIMPQGGASVEAATGKRRELMKAPISGEDLPFSKFTRRKKEIFDFEADDSGKTVYFCACFENMKGDAGPWGPVISAIIP